VRLSYIINVALEKSVEHKSGRREEMGKGFCPANFEFFWKLGKGKVIYPTVPPGKRKTGTRGMML